MSEPYVGEIRMFAGNFAPDGWAFCDGQLLNISENDVLYTLIGTTYGGDGQATFAVPDLRGRLPMHQGSGVPLAQTGGVEAVTLTAPQLPAHQHSFLTAAPASTGNPKDASLAANPDISVTTYGTDSPYVPYPAGLVSTAGGSQPHANMQPYLCINFIIALFGIFPSQS